MSTKTAALRALFAQIPASSLKTRRAIDRDDIRTAIRSAKQAKRRVRVYSSAGFVPNSYRGRCEIQYVEVDVASGRCFTGWTGAQRPRGNGSLVVVQ